jgi:hypothetical protein
MSRKSRARAMKVSGFVVIVLLAGWGTSAAQFTEPKYPTYTKPTLDDLAKTEWATKLEEALKKIKDLEELSDKQDQYLKDLEKLSPDDDQYEPDYDPPGSPELPSLCKDAPECKACFKQPYADLQNTRFRFDKLRRLNKVTKDMLRDAISFGDAAANLAGGMAQLAWTSEKTRIRGAEQNFNKSYDAKYDELLATLKDNLLGIAACESEIFGNEAWYDRFGFMYQQFMAEAYRRPN